MTEDHIPNVIAAADRGDYLPNGLEVLLAAAAPIINLECKPIFVAHGHLCEQVRLLA